MKKAEQKSVVLKSKIICVDRSAKFLFMLMKGSTVPTGHMCCTKIQV